jgi:hypothetical protein
MSRLFSAQSATQYMCAGIHIRQVTRLSILFLLLGTGWWNGHEVDPPSLFLSGLTFWLEICYSRRWFIWF